MTKRGKRSAADLSVIPSAMEWRPAPPDDLSAKERAIWELIVSRFPGDFFPPETLPLLKALCRHAVLADELSQIIERNRDTWADDDFARLNRVTAMRDRETRSMLACARSLRLTKQAQIEPRTAARQAARNLPGARPWEPDFRDG